MPLDRSLPNHLSFELWVPASIEEVWNFHSSAEALFLLTPPASKLQTDTKDLDVREGAKQVFYATQPGPLGIPIRMRWEAEIYDVNQPHQFKDRALKSPFKLWNHTHLFEKKGSGTQITDQVTYQLPFGFLGRVVNKLFVQRQLEDLFQFRHKVTGEHLGRQPNSP